MAVEMTGGDEKKKTKDSSFHDFLGMSCGGDSPWGRARDVGERAAAREAGEAAISAASSGVRGVDPTGSDLNSGRKRSYSDSSFMGLPKERLLPVAADSPEWPRLMKAYGKDVIDERPKRSSHDDEMTLAVPSPSKQNSVSLHPAVGGRQDHVYSKWERSMNVNAAHMGQHHLSRFSQGGACMDKNSSACKDANAGTVLVSPAAADEGSRTGMKGSGVLKILNSSSMAMEKNATGVLSSSPKPSNIPQITEPESSNMSSHHGNASVGRQMTIFYAGQAHVFDDVHPSKADYIMALAGSRGGSWSINYSVKSGNYPQSEEKVRSRENQSACVTPHFSQDHGGRFQIHNLLPLAQPPVAAIPMTSPGTQQSGGMVVRDAGPTIVPETNAEHKRNV